jgi:hypothetical protein
VKALAELSQRLGKTVLISHSQSGIFPFQTATISRRASPESSRSSRVPVRPPTTT